MIQNLNHALVKIEMNILQLVQCRDIVPANNTTGSTADISQSK